MKRLAGFTSLLLLAALTAAASTSRIYVLNNQGNTIDVIDPATNKVIQKIQGVPHSHGVSFSPDGRHAYITSETEDTLYDVDTATGNTSRKLALTKGSANLPATSRDGKRIYVCINGLRDEKGNMVSSLPGAVDIVDAKSFTAIKTIPMKGGMHDCYVTPDGKYVIASSLGGKFLSVIDPATDRIEWTIDFDKGVTTSAFEVGPDGSTSRIFSPLSDFHGFAIIDFAKHKEVGRVQLPDTPNDFQLGGALARRNFIPTHGDSISPDGKRLWVASRSSNGIFVYSLPDLKLIRYIPTARNSQAKHPLDGGDPGWLTFSRDGKTAYVANAAINSVSVIDTQAMKEVDVIPVGAQPDHVETLVIPGN